MANLYLLNIILRISKTPIFESCHSIDNREQYVYYCKETVSKWLAVYINFSWSLAVLEITLGLINPIR